MDDVPADGPGSEAPSRDVPASHRADEEAPLVLGTAIDEVRTLAASIGGRLEPVPLVGDGGPAWPWAAHLDAWRRATAAGPQAATVVVAVWLPGHAQQPVVELGPAAWVAAAEEPLAAWTAALACAAARCAGDGTIVAVVERPLAVDGGGWGPASAVAQGVEALVRSCARAVGPRSIRVNGVTTPARLPGDPEVAPPALDWYPGTVGDQVAATVRLLTSPDAAALTGTVVDVDAGRGHR